MEKEEEIYETLKNQLLGSPEFKKTFDDFSKFILENFKSNIDKLNSRMNELEENLNSRTDNVSQLSTENSRLSKTNRDLSAENNKLSAENIKLGLQVQSLTKELESLNSDITSYKTKLLEINKERDALKIKTEKSDSIISALQDEKNKLQNDLSSRVVEINDYIKRFELFVRAESFFTDYNSMSEDTKNRLESIFEAKSYTGFISNGLQWDNISILWNFMKKKIIENDLSDIQVLIQIFRYFFDFYNSGLKEARYILIEPVAGNAFDKSTCTVVGAGMDGKIVEVLLPGYKDIKTEEVYKALVSVK